MSDNLNILNEFDASNEYLFERISADIKIKGYSINPDALPIELGNSLIKHLSRLRKDKFNQAKIGRDKQLMRNEIVRGDKLSWVTDDSDAGKEWLHWVAQMQTFLNRRLFLGLFSFESHFSHYSPRDFYRRHYDAFKGDVNRVLSLVVYLNPNWLPEYAGNLVLYTDENDCEGIKVTPSFGTVVAFLSEDFPHEVQITQRDRYSIAGWFKVNEGVADPR